MNNSASGRTSRSRSRSREADGEDSGLLAGLPDPSSYQLAIDAGAVTNDQRDQRRDAEIGALLQLSATPPLGQPSSTQQIGGASESSDSSSASRAPTISNEPAASSSSNVPSNSASNAAPSRGRGDRSRSPAPSVDVISSIMQLLQRVPGLAGAQARSLAQRLGTMEEYIGDDGEEEDAQEVDGSFIPPTRPSASASNRVPAQQRANVPAASPRIVATSAATSSSIPSTSPRSVRRPAHSDRESRRLELEEMQDQLEEEDDLDLESNGISAPLGPSIVRNALRHAPSLIEYIRSRRGNQIATDRNYKELIEWAHTLDAMWRGDYDEAFESAARRFAGVLESERTGSWDYADAISRHAENVSLLPSSQLQRVVKSVSTNRTMTRGGGNPQRQSNQQRPQKFSRQPYQQQQQQQQDGSAPNPDGAAQPPRSNYPGQNRRGGFNGGRGGSQRQ